MSEYKPPFHMTNKIANLLASISKQIGRITLLSDGSNNPKLRRENRIRTIHASLAIEHNTLSIEQVTAILAGKRILGNPNEIREVENAYQAYEMMLDLDPLMIEDLLKAHRIMMEGLISQNGRFRSGGVGVFDGDNLVHMATPAKLVPHQIEALFNWYKVSDIHPLIKSAIFHYEFEFIHPFADGNGRLGRMWHSMLLGKWEKIFYWLPVETLIRTRQTDYYEALGKSDKAADSAVFVEFMLDVIFDTLKNTLVVGNTNNYDNEVLQKKIKQLLDVIGDDELSTNEIMNKLELKHKPNFRKNYLNPALKQGLLEMTLPEKPKSKNQKYRKRLS